MVDIIVTHYGARDDEGNQPEPTEGPTLTGCAVAPTVNRETGERASDATVERLTVYCPDPDADVHPTSTLTIGDDVYEVDGYPQRWANPFTGARPGCVIDITRTVG